MQSFPIEPGSIKWLGITSIVALELLASVDGLLTATIWGARHAVFEVTQEGLKLRGDLYGRLIPAREILITEASKVNLQKNLDCALVGAPREQVCPAIRQVGFVRKMVKRLWFI